MEFAINHLLEAPRQVKARMISMNTGGRAITCSIWDEIFTSRPKGELKFARSVCVQEREPSRVSFVTKHFVTIFMVFLRRSRQEATSWLGMLRILFFRESRTFANPFRFANPRVANPYLKFSLYAVNARANITKFVLCILFKSDTNVLLNASLVSVEKRHFFGEKHC